MSKKTKTTGTNRFIGAMNRPMVIAFLGMMIALDFVFERYIVINAGPFSRFSLTFVPRAICGLLLGMFPAALAGGVSDLIGAVIFYGVPNPGITLAAVLRGFLYGGVLYRKASVPKVLLCAVINQFVISWGLVSLSLCWFSGAPLNWTFFVGRLPQCCSMFVVECVVLVLLTKTLFPYLQKNAARMGL